MRQFGGPLIQVRAAAATGAPFPIERMQTPWAPIVPADQCNVGGQVAMKSCMSAERGTNTTLWTNLASGGCVPICAAEVAAGPRDVRWRFLAHATSKRDLVNLVGPRVDPARVFVCFLFNSATFHDITLEYREPGATAPYFEALDPDNLIPNANVFALYAPNGSLAIDGNAGVGFVAGQE